MVDGRELWRVILVAATSVAALLPCHGYPEGASKEERAKLDLVAAEIEGWLLYTRPPRKDKGESSWMAEKFRIGEWMTVNHGDHKTMAIWNKDLKHMVKLDANKLVVPHGSWDNYHWSNHNNYLAMKSDAHWAGGYKGRNDVFLLKFSEKRVTRMTFNVEPEYPDLFVVKDLKTGRTDPGTAGLGKSPSIKAVGAVPDDPLAAFRPPDRKLPLTKVAAVLETMTPLPSAKDIKTREYDNWLVEHIWRVKRLLLGELQSDHILVSHWAVKKRQMIPDYLVQGKTYQLMLEPWGERKDLHGEGRIPADKDKVNFDWPVFVDVGPPRPKPKPPKKPKAPPKPPPKPPKKPDLDIPDGDEDDLDLDL